MWNRNSDLRNLSPEEVQAKIDAGELPSLEEMTQKNAEALCSSASFKAVALFNTKKFQDLSKPLRTTQLESDRILNELILANLTMMMLLFEAPDLEIPDEFKQILLITKNELPKAHVRNIKAMGLEEEFLKDWEKLIQMRYDEYSKNKYEAREAAMTVESQHKGQLTAKDLEGIHLMLPMQTVAIGCHHHVCRSKTDGYDDLFLHMFKEMGKFYVELRVTLLSGPITIRRRILLRIFKGPRLLRKFVSQILGYKE